MKLGKSREKALKHIEYFVSPEWKLDKHSDQWGVFSIPESSDGVSAEEAFFAKSEKGSFPKSLTIGERQRLLALLWGQRWMATHEKMWREGFAECSLSPSDFKKEPGFIQEMARKACEKEARTWKK